MDSRPPAKPTRRRLAFHWVLALFLLSEAAVIVVLTLRWEEPFERLHLIGAMGSGAFAAMSISFGFAFLVFALRGHRVRANWREGVD
jgi:hypothetical protein